VLYNNRYADARGWARTSVAFAVKSGAGKALAQKCLGEGLSLPDDPGAYVVFREHLSGLQYIRNCRELWEKGMYVELGAYRTQVFLDFSIVFDDQRGRWSGLAAELAGRGVPSIDISLRERELRAVRDPFDALLELDETMGGLAACRADPAVANHAAVLYAEFLRAAQERAHGGISERACIDDFLDRVRRAPPTRAANGQPDSVPAPARAFLLPWTILRPLCGADPADSRVVSWIEEWMLAPLLRDYLVRQGWDGESGEAFPALFAVALRAESMKGKSRPAGSVGDGPAEKPARKRAPKSSARGPFPWHDLLSDPAAERFLRVNLFEGVRWFNREALALLLQCLEMTGAFEGARRQTPKKQVHLAPPSTHARLLQRAEDCRFQWEPFLESIAHK
jgi:hypothetical protein